MIPTLYRGSVKDLLGPTQVNQTKAVLFEYTDAFSVFDWGRMPELLPKKGEALAVLAAELFEKLERPESWREFSKTTQALALRKANRFGSSFNELGEELQSKGLRTHYLGVLSQLPQNAEVEPQKTIQMVAPFRRLVAKQVSVVRPALSPVLGRILPDYDPTRNSPLPRLVPLEVVFRMGCPQGSSLIERTARDPSYLSNLGFPDLKVEVGSQWDFPLLELFTKLETVDRLVHLSEALALSGLAAKQLQEVLLKTAWVAGILKYWCSKCDLELADGKLEWAISEEGNCFLVDGIGPDELRITKKEVQLSKEFLRLYYRNTKWFQNTELAKAHAKTQGTPEWKRFVQEGPPPLPSHYRELATQVYFALTNELSGRKWFPEAWSLEKVVEELREIQKGGHS